MNGLYHTDFYFFFIFSILKTVEEKDAFASSQWSHICFYRLQYLTNWA